MLKNYKNNIFYLLCEVHVLHIINKNQILLNLYSMHVFYKFTQYKLIEKLFFFKFIKFKKKNLTTKIIDNTQNNKNRKIKNTKLNVWFKIQLTKKYNLKKKKLKFYDFFYNYKIWKYAFIKRNKIIKSKNFSKYLKSKIMYSQIATISFFSNISKKKQCCKFFLLFKNLSNKQIFFNLYAKKIMFTFLYYNTILKYKKYLSIYNHKKNLISIFIQNELFFYQKKKIFLKKKKPFFAIHEMNKNIKRKIKRRVKKWYWLKKNNLQKAYLRKNYFFNKNTLLFKMYPMNNVHYLKIKNRNSLNFFLNIIINLWNIRSYNWKQII